MGTGIWMWWRPPQDDDTVAWFENTDGGGTFGAEQVITNRADWAVGVAVGDIDGDGDLDVVAASQNDNTVAWFKNNGNALLVNDSDPDGDPLTAVLVTDVSNGTLVLNTNGTFTYTPDPDFSGVDSFTYKANDGTADSNTVTVTLNVTAVNDAPVLDNTGAMVLTDISEDDGTSSGDTVAALIASAGGDRITDVDVGAVEGMAVIGVDDTNGQWQYDAGGGWTAFGAVSNTSAVLLDTTGLIRFVPNADYTGSAGNLTFRAWDTTAGADGDTGVDVSTNGTTTAYSMAMETATLTVTAVNDAPVNTVPGAQVVAEDMALAISGISVNDVDGNLSTVQLGVINGTVTVTLSGGATISAGANGTNTLTLSGPQADINATLASLNYQGTLNYNGPDTLTMTSTDGNSATDVDVVGIMVTGANDAPVITSHGGGVSATLSLAENLTGVTTMTATDPEGNPLTYSLVGGADAARFAIDPNTGALRFAAAPDFEQPTDVGGNNVYDVHVQVSDGFGGIDTQSLAISVTDVIEGTAPPPPSPPDPTPESPPEPPPEPAPELPPDPGLPKPPGGGTGEGSGSGNPGGGLGRAPEEDAQFGKPHDVVDVLDLPPLMRPASWAITADQIRSYYPDPLTLGKTELSVEFLQQLNAFSEELQQTMTDQTEERSLFVNMMESTGLVLSAGLAAWILRGGAVLAWFMASLPMWRHFDPVPILNMDREERDAWMQRVKEATKMEAREHHGLEHILGESAQEKSESITFLSFKSEESAIRLRQK